MSELACFPPRELFFLVVESLRFGVRVRRGGPLRADEPSRGNVGVAVRTSAGQDSGYIHDWG